jgi:guanylate kinase
MSTKARLFVISGPSGSGKTSLIRDALTGLDGFEKSVSATTRKMRKGEREGKQYFFTTEEKFRQMIGEGLFLEWAEYAGDLYGTPEGFVRDRLEKGINVILEIEIRGAMQVMEKTDGAFFIFILTTSMDELRQRLENRGTDSREDIEKRLRIAGKELEQKKYYDCIIVNNNYNEALRNLIEVLERESGRKENSEDPVL